VWLFGWICEKTRNLPGFLGFKRVMSNSSTRGQEGFRVNARISQRLYQSKRRLARRLDKTNIDGAEQPMYTASNIHYEIAGRTRGLSHGGIGAIHALARHIGLIDAIDDRLHLLKIHLPFHESDHVLNFAYNAMCEGTCLEDIELRRQDEVYLDALGARRIPDPTTAGDFCRRFSSGHIRILQDVFHDTRIGVWAKQSAAFFEQAIIDMDGTLTPTTGACKQGMDIAYDGTWGYHPLVLTLANTGEVLSIVNRPGNRPSHEGAAAEVDGCLEVCFRGGFHTALLRGDTDFSQTAHLDRWNADARVHFIFGYDNTANLRAMAEHLPACAWRQLQRPKAQQPLTGPRQRPANVKDEIVRRRQYETLRLQSEDVAEFNYQPNACSETYRMIVVAKNISRQKGEARLFDEIRYFFYITNDWVAEADQIVFSANDRCHQENLLAQLHSGCRALKAPVDNLESNWAYMVMTALAWNLKAWWALTLPEQSGRWQQRYRDDKRWLLGLEFKTFLQAFVRLPCQLVRTGRKLLFRLLSWNPHQTIFFRLVAALRC
jgi:Transposase DDE domain group 1